MTFNNEAQLKKFLSDKCAIAVDNAKARIHNEFVNNLNKFYSEFDPEEYIRTGSLFNSLKTSDVKRGTNSATAEVYFDIPQYEHGWVELKSGTFGYSYWTDDYILDVAMKGKRPHGGYRGGTAIWHSTMGSLGGSAGIENLLIQELKGQGL